jgi:hypothetical protein
MQHLFHNGDAVSSQRLLLLLLSLSLAWVGCDDEPTLTPDAGTGNPDGGMDASTPDDPTAVTLTRVYRYHSASGMKTVDDTTTTVVPEVLIPEGESFRRIEGTSTGGANYRFTGIPAGTPYYLKRGSTYVVTDARTVDLSTDLLGQPDAGVANTTGLIDIRFDLSGLEPQSEWQNSSFTQLLIVSGEQEFATSVYANIPVGQSTFTGEEQTVNFSAPWIPQFIAERGDRAWVNQLTTRDAGALSDGGTITYESLVRSLHLPPFSYDGSTPLDVRGTLQPVPMTAFSLDWPLSDFAAYTSAAHPSATVGSSTFILSPAAHGLEYGWVGYLGDMLLLNTRRGTTENIVLSLSYGNPFPSSWGVIGSALLSFRYPATLSNGSAVTLSSSVSVTDWMPALVAGPVVPRMSPPRGLTLNGQDAYVPQRLEGSPVVSWMPPELGAPSLYTLTLYRYDMPEGSTLPRQIVAARFYLTGAARSVRLPAELLQPGKDYFLRLAAASSPGVDLSRAPIISGNSIPHYSASTVSAILTTP